MLSLSQKLSLNTIRPLGEAWVPTPGADNMIAWWQKATDVSMSGSAPYGVSRWNDQSGNNYHMAQGTASAQPTGAGNIGQSNGQVWFDQDTVSHLDIPQITVVGDFTIAMLIKVFNVGGALLSDNTDAGEFLRVTSNTEMRIKIANSTAMNIDLDAGTYTDGETRLIITRNGTSGEIKLHRNSVMMSGSGTNTDEFQIDVFGVRKTNLNPFDGYLTDCSIYNSQSDALTSQLDDYLKSIQ